MVSAIVMAGYSNKREVKKYSRIVSEHYGERFIETGYKPLREFQTVENGFTLRKPVIQFTLEKLFESDFIEEIVIVGHRMLLEQRLGKFINGFDKPCKIINQNARIPPHAMKRFDIIPKRVKHTSLAGNFIKGYTASAAYDNGKHTLCVAADSPFTTREFIENFLNVVEDYQQNSAIIVPGILIPDKEDKLGRRPLLLRNDTSYQLSDKKDDFGRQGYRLSSLLYANPNQFDVNTINTAYNLRKFLSPKIQLQLFRITRSLGYKNVYSKYFVQKDLSIKECEAITSAFFKGRLTIIPMIGEEATFDYDGTDKEFQRISELLNPREA
jgi:CTP:molybdopterin cytidylyltransferase MocA